MKSKIQVIEYVCDNPDCASMHRVRKDEELPMGYHGKVYRVYSLGGTEEQDWFACKTVCIEQAVRAVTGDFNDD